MSERFCFYTQPLYLWLDSQIQPHRGRVTSAIVNTSHWPTRWRWSEGLVHVNTNDTPTYEEVKKKTFPAFFCTFFKEHRVYLLQFLSTIIIIIIFFNYGFSDEPFIVNHHQEKTLRLQVPEMFELPPGSFLAFSCSQLVYLVRIKMPTDF